MNISDSLSQKPCICINFRRITQKITELYDKELSPTGLTINQYSLLVNISRIEGCCISELAQQVKQEKSTLVRTLQPLFKAELIFDRSTNESRRRLLFLTASGKNRLKNARPLWEKAQQQITSTLGCGYDELLALFEKIDHLE